MKIDAAYLKSWIPAKRWESVVRFERSTQGEGLALRAFRAELYRFGRKPRMFKSCGGMSGHRLTITWPDGKKTSYFASNDSERDSLACLGVVMMCYMVDPASDLWLEEWWRCNTPSDLAVQILERDMSMALRVNRAALLQLWWGGV